MAEQLDVQRRREPGHVRLRARRQMTVLPSENERAFGRGNGGKSEQPCVAQPAGPAGGPHRGHKISCCIADRPDPFVKRLGPATVCFRTWSIKVS